MIDENAYISEIRVKSQKSVEEKGMSEMKGKKLKRFGWIAATVLLAAVCFIGGMATVWFTLDPQIRMLVKVKKTIDEHYYQELDD